LPRLGEPGFRATCVFLVIINKSCTYSVNISSFLFFCFFFCVCVSKKFTLRYLACKEEVSVASNTRETPLPSSFSGPQVRINEEGEK